MAFNLDSILSRSSLEISGLASFLRRPAALYLWCGFGFGASCLTSSFSARGSSFIRQHFFFLSSAAFGSNLLVIVYSSDR
jgi:hypothetical protein